MFVQLKTIKSTRIRGIRHRISLLRREQATLAQTRKDVLDAQRTMRAQWREQCAVSALVSVRQFGKLKLKLANYHRRDQDFIVEVGKLDERAVQLDRDLDAERASLREHLRAEEKLDYLIEHGAA
jgi:hypothetical protein